VSEVAGITLVERFPAADDYRRLRLATGLSAKSAEAAQRGLAHTIYGVSLMQGEAVVGMGRIVGDDGCFYFVVDIAVEPALQGRGLGKRIMSALDAWLKAQAPKTAHVSLFADGDAKHLYEQYGFAQSAKSVGMFYRIAD
jgi:GNAT superfamily N-acetyltransferase